MNTVTVSTGKEDKYPLPVCVNPICTNPASFDVRDGLVWPLMHCYKCDGHRARIYYEREAKFKAWLAAACVATASVGYSLYVAFGR